MYCIPYLLTAFVGGLIHTIKSSSVSHKFTIRQGQVVDQQIKQSALPTYFLRCIIYHHVHCTLRKMKMIKVGSSLLETTKFISYPNSKFKIFFSTFWRPPQASEMSADDDSNSNLNLTYWFNVPGAGSFWCWLLQTQSSRHQKLPAPGTLNQQVKFKFELESSSGLISEAYGGRQKVEKKIQILNLNLNLDT